MIRVLAFAVGAVVTTEFIVIGLLPVLASDLSVPLHRAGLLVSAFAIAAAVLGPVLTLAVSHRQPGRVLSASLIVFGAANLAAAVMPSFAVLVAARLVQGALLTVIISVASTTASALAGPERAGLAIGQVNLGTVLATLLAMPAGTALADLIGWRPVFAGLGVAALIAAAAVTVAVPHVAARDDVSLRQQAGILRRGRFIAHLGLSVLLFTALFSAYSYAAAFLTRAVGLAPAAVGPALFGFGLAGVAGNWAAMRVVDRGATRLTVVVAGALVLALGALTLWHAERSVAVWLLAGWGAAHMAAFVACQVRVIFAAPDVPAFAASLNIAVCNLGIALGAVLGGWVVSRWGIAQVGLGTVMVGVPALVLGVALLRSERSVIREQPRRLVA